MTHNDLERPCAPSSAQRSHRHLRQRSLTALLDENFPEKAPLLGPWLTEKHLSMVYAPAGVGKSWFALAAALAVASGGAFLEWDAPQPRKVLVVDGEMDPEDLKARAASLLPAVGGNPQAAGENLRFLAQKDQTPGTAFPDLATDEGRAQLLAVVHELKPALVVLDNFSTLATVENENDASSFNPVLDLLVQLKLTRAAAMLVHHSRKSGQHQGSYRGTSKMGVVFNSIIRLGHPDGIQSTQGAVFDMQFEKYRGRRDESVLPKRVSLESGEHDKTRWTAEPLGAEKVAALVALVRECRHSSQDALANAMATTKGTVSKWKMRALRDGLIAESEWDACLREARENQAGTSEFGEDF